MTIKQFKEKLTRKQAGALAERAQPVLNLHDKLPQALDIMCALYYDPVTKITIEDLVRAKGKPLITIPEYESNPGLWIFDDEETGIRFLTWSDCWKKNCYKGTSFEVIEGTKGFEGIDKAFDSLVAFLKQK